MANISRILQCNIIESKTLKFIPVSYPGLSKCIWPVVDLLLTNNLQGKFSFPQMGNDFVDVQISCKENTYAVTLYTPVRFSIDRDVTHL